MSIQEENVDYFISAAARVLFSEFFYIFCIILLKMVYIRYIFSKLI